MDVEAGLALVVEGRERERRRNVRQLGLEAQVDPFRVEPLAQEPSPEVVPGASRQSHLGTGAPGGERDVGQRPPEADLEPRRAAAVRDRIGADQVDERLTEADQRGAPARHRRRG